MNNKEPLVSIIMNCYNGERYLRQAIDSVYAQTYNNWEIIFWDNYSIDRSAQIAKSYNSKLKYFKGDNKICLGEARNKAIDKCSGEYIAFLDCDDLWLPKKLEMQIPLFKDIKVGIAISNVVYFSSNNDEKKLYRFSSPPTGNVFANLLENYFVAMPTVMIRRESLLSLDSWFDPEFNLVEDFDLITRISYKWELGYVNCVLAKYRIHGESYTSKKRENFPVEMKKMLIKYNDLIPNFNQHYKKQIYKLNRIIDWLDAQNLAISGSFKDASKKIKKYSFDSIKWFTKYIMLSLPIIRNIFIKKILNRI